MKLPVYVAPASSTIVSPGCALTRACWKSPPAGTLTMVPRRMGAETNVAQMQMAVLAQLKNHWRLDFFIEFYAPDACRPPDCRNFERAALRRRRDSALRVATIQLDVQEQIYGLAACATRPYIGSKGGLSIVNGPCIRCAGLA